MNQICTLHMEPLFMRFLCTEDKLVFYENFFGNIEALKMEYYQTIKECYSTLVLVILIDADYNISMCTCIVLELIQVLVLVHVL